MTSLVFLCSLMPVVWAATAQADEIRFARQFSMGYLQFNLMEREHLVEKHARAAGIAAIYQQPALFADLSVAENVALGLEKPSLCRRIKWKERFQRASDLLARAGARISPAQPVSSLSMPEQQLVEIARALGAGARILIMDEPSASLTSA